ncbi:Nif3-like dinuclear metal center hexameric protein [Pectinatus frisingensis]|uniref:Nif3-like dinuclear metal center hexameric protein n=1 Tax=Pectinatus frisingensis TaxID=865 RepID=UPI0018C4A11C|nr:Nif3-like dinuclear metal center hexameric protein [Pectinatus frisingensis]
MHRNKKIAAELANSQLPKNKLARRNLLTLINDLELNKYDKMPGYNGCNGKIAPRILAEEWDNPGLLLGSPSQTINKIIICLDVNSQVVEKAITEKCDLIISHHPFIFHAIKKIRTDLPQGHLIQKLLQNNIAVFAAHTNLDSAHGGINDLLCELWNLHDVAPLDISFKRSLSISCIRSGSPCRKSSSCTWQGWCAGFIGKLFPLQFRE